MSAWFNPDAWIHFTSDHFATNRVLPLSADTCALYLNWDVHENAVDGEDFSVEQLTDVWKVTNAENVMFFHSMTSGARSHHKRPWPFTVDERSCMQSCRL